jgi:signal transduction histidine kinase
MTNLRVVMDNLHPQTLDILGLSAAIESQLEKLGSRKDDPQYHFMAGEDVADLPLSPLVQVTLYRIAVEAIHNVLRHAGASMLEVALQRRADRLVLAVEDNGRGFDYAPSLPSETGGRGLHNINERARAIGAQVSWGGSRFSSGTRFELTLQLKAV